MVLWINCSDFIFDRIFVKLASNEDSHKISDEFDFGLDRIVYCGVIRPCATKIFLIDL